MSAGHPVSFPQFYFNNFITGFRINHRLSSTDKKEK